VTGQRRLTAVPSRREQQALDWLAESASAPARDVLERAFAELPQISQRPAWPWTRLQEGLRPEPFGSRQARLLALAIVAMVLLTLFAGTVLTAGQRGVLGLVIGPAPNLAPDARAVFPLASPRYEIVAIGDDQLFTILSDGTQRTSAGEDISGKLRAPEWGPRRSVLVQETSATSEQIWLVDASGLRPSQVIVPCVSPCGSRNEASWSNDGTKIAMFQAFGGPVNGIPIDCGVGLYDATSLAVTKLTSSPCAVIEERNPRFSPDDRVIAFWRSRSPGRVAVDAIEDSALFTKDLETGVETQVTDWTTHASMFDWSPDGAWIVFVPDAYDLGAAAADLWRVHPDGTGLERLSTVDTASVQLARPRYSPDGAWILFARLGEDRDELLAIPASGGQPIAVLPGTTVSDFDVLAAN
jgi:hypothetical protein